MKNTKYAIVDYYYALRGQTGSFTQKPRSRYPLLDNPKGHIILVPGIYEKWYILKKLGDFLYAEGYQIHAVEAIKRNRQSTSKEASKLQRYLTENSIDEAVIVGHSKGGLVGLEYILHFDDTSHIKKLIAIATPFSGTHIGRWVRLRAVRDMLPGSAMLPTPQGQELSADVVSIFPEYDNHVLHPNSSRLEGAKNIKLSIKGHHKILFDKGLFELVREEVEQLYP